MEVIVGSKSQKLSANGKDKVKGSKNLLLSLLQGVSGVTTDQNQKDVINLASKAAISFLVDNEFIKPSSSIMGGKITFVANDFTVEKATKMTSSIQNALAPLIVTTPTRGGR